MKKNLQEQPIDWRQGIPRTGGGTPSPTPSPSPRTSGGSGEQQLIIPPKKEEKSAGENLDQKVEELEKDIESIKDSKTAQIVKEKWNKLLNDAKNAGAAASTELEILRLRQKIDTAASKVTPAGQTMNFIDCTGWNTLGCKSESIKKVQTCLNLGVSGNFDEFLKSELARYKSTYAFREGFSDSDVQKICIFKQEEDRQEALKREQLAKQAQKDMEDQAFERNYPQKTTKATRRDKF
jgi:predicted GIY-YIG superfamily endonuclease